MDLRPVREDSLTAIITEDHIIEGTLAIANYCKEINTIVKVYYEQAGISDTYTGRRWERSRRTMELEKEDYYYDFYELLTALAKEEEAGSNITNMI
jgi:hypothetical protein